MNDIRETVGTLDGAGKRFGIVASRFNGRLVSPLIDGAVDCLLRHGVARGDLHLVRVPGAWEIAGALDELARGGGLDALVALGVVIRGETSHYDHLCAAASDGIARVASECRLPVGYGLLTCETTAQAAERAGGKAGNKGWEAALAALEMAGVYAALRAVGG